MPLTPFRHRLRLCGAGGCEDGANGILDAIKTDEWTFAIAIYFKVLSGDINQLFHRCIL